MRAIEIRRDTDQGGLLTLTERDKPAAEQGEILIRVAAAGINRPDILQRKGLYPPPPGITDIPGLEVAGEVVESNSDQFAPGEKVAALLAGGGYAEYVNVPAGQCLGIPSSLDMSEAAALPETLFTVWNNLFISGRFSENKTVLVHGGASGIGTMAISLIKAFKGTVFVTAGSDEKCQRCIEIGADKAINYKEKDFLNELGQSSVDIVLDMVGGSYVAKNMEVLKEDGIHVSIAFLDGAKAEIPVPLLMKKRLTLTGSTLRARSTAYKMSLRDELAQKVLPLIEQGIIRPQLFKTFPLEKAQEAHAYLEQGDHFGKIVLEIK
jgi:NADPH2:quinone reductase